MEKRRLRSTRVYMLFLVSHRESIEAVTMQQKMVGKEYRLVEHLLFPKNGSVRFSSRSCPLLIGQVAATCDHLRHSFWSPVTRSSDLLSTLPLSLHTIKSINEEIGADNQHRWLCRTGTSTSFLLAGAFGNLPVFYSGNKETRF